MSEPTVAALAADIRRRKVSALEVVEACLERVGRLDSRLRAFITVDAEGARRVARERDAELAAGRARGPLHGVPLAWKDLCFVRGLPTSCGTRTPEYFVADRDCTAVRRLQEAGAVALGKLNMSELALGPFGDNSHHGDVANPWRLTHCAGGSSSGSGAAVAAGLVAGALGTDTGGSIRLPAAFCGIVGLKPTYGRVSRSGVMPLSWSNDHLGPMTRTVRDAALLLGVMAGADAADATASRRRVPDYLAGLDDGVAGLRVGLAEDRYFAGVDAEIGDAVVAVARALERAGARVAALRLPDLQPMTDVTGLISRAESAAVHVRVVRERPHELGPVVRARLESGFALSAYDYIQATRLRARFAREFLREVFREVDVVLAPTTPHAAVPLAEVTGGPVEAAVRRGAAVSRLTRPFNGLGVPVLAMPSGLSRSGLPLSAQVVGRPFDESTVLRVAQAWERIAGGFPAPPSSAE